jgi:hypothetical protein
MLCIQDFPIFNEFPSHPTNEFSNPFFVAPLILGRQVD